MWFFRLLLLAAFWDYLDNSVTGPTGICAIDHERRISQRIVPEIPPFRILQIVHFQQAFRKGGQFGLRTVRPPHDAPIFHYSDDHSLR